MKSLCFLSTLKIEVITASESLVHTYQYIRRYIPEDRNLSGVFSELGYTYNDHGQKELKRNFFFTYVGAGAGIASLV